MVSKRDLILFGLGLALLGALLLKHLIIIVGVFLFAYGLTMILLALRRDLKKLLKKLGEKAE